MAGKTPILIFCRIKPYLIDSGLDIQDYSINSGAEKDVLTISCQQASSVVNHKPDCYNFHFKKVFDQFTTQEVIYDTVASPVVKSALAGYNGTIFAYGQTGSGKTYTISGETVNQGIVPRALCDIFSAINNENDTKYDVEVSYLELYNEQSNDLLIPSSEKKKISLREASDKVMEWHNLSMCSVDSFSEAMNLLAVGDSNRIVCDTPMNVFSSRSHTILTIYLTAHLKENCEIRRAKLNLVDLAGSERVHKTGEEGLVLEEARHINLSLHYLEQVIVALSDTSRTHVPYRNCTMTSALRDSLGGNCMTVMVANIAVDKANMEETISTCRFSQRVALVRNELNLNTERDVTGENSQLKSEILQLRNKCCSLQLRVKELEQKIVGDEKVIYPDTDQQEPTTCDGETSVALPAKGVKQLQTDIIYLIEWLQDELNARLAANHGSSNTSFNSRSVLSTAEPDEGFSSFISSLDAKDDWFKAKETEEQASEALKIKVDIINSVHQDILNWWKRHEKSLVKEIMSGRTLNIMGSESTTDMTAFVTTPQYDLAVDTLLNTHSDLLKDFQLLKSRLQSSKRNLQRIKRKYLVEYNNWRKSDMRLPLNNLEKEIHDMNNSEGVNVEHAEGIEINHYTNKHFKSNSERNISLYFKNSSCDNRNLISETSFSLCSDLDTTFGDLNDSVFSTSTLLFDKRMNPSNGSIPNTGPRQVRSVPCSLHMSVDHTRSCYTNTTGRCEQPLSRSNNHGDGQTQTSILLTGDEVVDDAIIEFYEKKGLIENNCKITTNLNVN